MVTQQRVAIYARVSTLDKGQDPETQLSLSRLNYRLPGGEAHPEIVQGTAELHHEIADARLPQTNPVFHNATTLDAVVDMLDPQPPLVERLVGPLLLQGQLRTAWLLRRHEDCHLGERERQEAQILQQPTITTGRKMYQNQRFKNVPWSVLGKLQTGRF